MQEKDRRRIVARTLVTKMHGHPVDLHELRRRRGPPCCKFGDRPVRDTVHDQNEYARCERRCERNPDDSQQVPHNRCAAANPESVDPVYLASASRRFFVSYQTHVAGIQ